MDQEAVSKTEEVIEQTNEIVQTKPIEQTKTNIVISNLDHQELEEINYQKKRLIRYKEDIDEWINQTTQTLDTFNIPMINDEKLIELKPIIENFKNEENSNIEENLKENLDMLQLLMFTIESNKQGFSDLAKNIGDLINNKLEISLGDEKSMRLAEVFSTREEAKDSDDKATHWWRLKYLEKLKDYIPDFALTQEEILIMRKKSGIVGKIHNLVKAINKADKTMKKADLETIRKKQKDLDRTKAQLENMTVKIDKKKEAAKKKLEKTETKKVKFGTASKSKSEHMSQSSQILDITKPRKVSKTSKSSKGELKSKKGTGIKKTGKGQRKESNSNAMNQESQLNKGLGKIDEEGQDPDKMCEENLNNKKSTEKLNSKVTKPQPKPQGIAITSFFKQTKPIVSILKNPEQDKIQNNTKMVEEVTGNIENNIQGAIKEPLVDFEPPQRFKKGLGSQNLNNDLSQSRQDDLDKNIQYLSSKDEQKDCYISPSKQNMEVSNQTKPETSLQSQKLINFNSAQGFESHTKILENLKVHFKEQKQVSKMRRKNNNSQDENLVLDIPLNKEDKNTLHMIQEEKQKKGTFQEDCIAPQNNSNIVNPRYVLIRIEDYTYDFVENKGVFKKKLDGLSAKNPFKRHDCNDIDYDMSSDEEMQLQDAESVGNTNKDDEEEDEYDEEDKEFVVPDGYLSESEVGSLDEEEKNIVRGKRPDLNETKNGFVLGGNLNSQKAFVIDFKNHEYGSDVNVDSLMTAFTCINIDEEDETFPINIKKDSNEIDVFEREVVIEMIRLLHGKESKKECHDEIKDTYMNLSNKQIQAKIKEMSTYGVWVNYDIFVKLNMTDEQYYAPLQNLMKNDLNVDQSDNESKDLNQDDSKDDNNNDKSSNDNDKQAPADVNTQNVDKTKDNKNKAKKNKEQINSRETLRFLISKLHGSTKGISDTKNRIFHEVSAQYPDCSIAQILKKSKEIARTGLIVNCDLFTEYVIKDEFKNLLQNRFDKEIDVQSKSCLSSVSKESVMPDLADQTKISQNVQSEAKPSNKMDVEEPKETDNIVKKLSAVKELPIEENAEQTGNKVVQKRKPYKKRVPKITNDENTQSNPQSKPRLENDENLVANNSESKENGNIQGPGGIAFKEKRKYIKKKDKEQQENNIKNNSITSMFNKVDKTPNDETKQKILEDKN